MLSAVLLAIDGTIFGAEVTAHGAIASEIRDWQVVKRIEFLATLLLLPDLGDGSAQGLVELRTLGGEAGEAAAQAAAKGAEAAASRARAARVSNPTQHPRSVQRHLHQANELAKEVEELRQKVAQMRLKMGGIRSFQLTAVPLATSASETLLAAELPEGSTGKSDRTLAFALPAGGIPMDVRLEIFVGSTKGLEGY